MNEFAFIGMAVTLYLAVGLALALSVCLVDEDFLPELLGDPQMAVVWIVTWPWVLSELFNNDDDDDNEGDPA